LSADRLTRYSGSASWRTRKVCFPACRQAGLSHSSEKWLDGILRVEINE